MTKVILRTVACVALGVALGAAPEALGASTHRPAKKAARGPASHAVPEACAFPKVKNADPLNLYSLNLKNQTSNVKNQLVDIVHMQGSCD